MTEKPVCLVTGGAGFIGSSFVADAVARGQKVVVLDKLTYAGNRENLSWIEYSSEHRQQGGSYELVVGDITDGALVEKLLAEHAIEAVVHFAAESHVDNSIHSPSAFIETNIVGSYVLLEAARGYYNTLPETKKKCFRFVQVSTDEVFGELPLESTEAFTEESPYHPHSPYSASKAAADHLARAWHRTYGLPVILTHCSNNYGPRQHKEKLIPHMVYCALAGKNLPVYGDGKNVRDWIHVGDHCHGIYLALTQGVPGETYAFGGRAERNNNTMVQAICTILDKHQPRADGASYATQITYVPDRLGHDRRYAIDDSKAEKELGFTRRYSFEAGLEETVHWYATELARAA